MATGSDNEDKGTSRPTHANAPANPSGVATQTSLNTVSPHSVAGQAAAPKSDSDDGSDDGLDEEATLEALTADVRDQDDIERDMAYQANLAIMNAEDERDQKRVERLEANIRRFESQKKSQEDKFRKAIGRPQLKDQIRQEIAHLDAEIELASKDIADFHARIEQRHQSNDDGTDLVQGGNRKMPNETHREFLIRTGKITPFANIGGPRPAGVEGELANALVDAEDEAIAEDFEEAAAQGPRSHRNLRAPGFADAEEVGAASALAQSEFSLRPRGARKKRRVQPSGDSSDEYQPAASHPIQLEADFVADEDESEDDYDLTELPHKKPAKAAKAGEDQKVNLGQIDDGNENMYQSRLADWCQRRSTARRQQQLAAGEPIQEAPDDDEPEWYKPHPVEPDHALQYGLKIPGDIFPSLFDYQKTGVQWLAELWDQRVGGIVGDEMGLGKTVQVISFISALHYSKQLDGPIIIVAPATVMAQWVNEFHRWWPPMRVSILHSSGSGMVNVKNEERIAEDDLAWEDRYRGRKTSSAAAKKIVKRVVEQGHVLITTYAGVQTYGDILVPVKWAYSVLDEGHKIRNANAAITIYCKELQTPNRIILSGTPMQNNLLELWSLFDFIFPMRLGTLVDFRNQFEIPIRLGGYANASNLQIMTAQKCAETLKDTISPYLLQRLKVDVAADLPAKSEKVLLCRLTKQQREVYELFLKSDDMASILNRTRQSLYGIDYLRKICNHPDLTDPNLKNRVSYKWGDPNKSGKMVVLKKLLYTWKKSGHKTLLFTQGVLMLDIIEKFVSDRRDIRFLRMDGKTPIKERQRLVDEFNNNPELDLFLLTTKVGGLGLNLTGANRVIIFDPDWNPSTDVQARERAWRLGQKKEVTIYRLLSNGTIEEKIYQRQIFKQLMTDKVLRDPKQRTAFASHDLHELFVLGADDDQTQTGKLFQDSVVKFGRLPTADGDANLSTSSNGNVLHPGTNQNKGKAIDEGKSSSSLSGSADDLTNIEGVAGVEDFRDPDDEQPPLSEEARILEGLFARSGVQSALEHDEIINGKRKPQPNRAMLQHAANASAAEAAASLRRAGEQARHIPIGTVTWTGEVGEAGRPGGPSRSNVRSGRGGPGSASILAGLRERQGLTVPGTASPGRSSSGASSARGGTPTAPARLGLRDFERMIPDFIRRHGGQVPTKLLVDHFNQYCSTPQQSSDFKAALNRVAKMEKKGGSMRGIWGLKG
ncbi:putative SNF2 family N-terminal domain-containing protein [Seiridium cardinale]